MVSDANRIDVEDATILRRWWSFAGLLLFAATWKLWTPQTEFAQVPLFGWAGSLPSFVDWLGFGVLLGSLAFSAWKPESNRIWIALAVSLGVLIIFDQHRLQPWTWQLLLLSVFLSSASSGQLGRVPYVALTISIYFWSAVSKLDTDFFSSHGQTLVEALFGTIRIDAAAWPGRWKWWLATTLPLGEMLVAVGLSWSRTRRAALIAATGLHVGLLLALGPLGLGHLPGVLLWNLAFIGHDWLLFGRRFGDATRWDGQDDFGAARWTPSLTLRVSLLALVCVWPVAARWGYCDRWLAWSVYGARSERVSVTLTDEGIRALPVSARRCVVDGELRLDQWSLAALDVPMYPQLRFQIGVVEWLRQRCGDDTLVEVIVQHSCGGGKIERLMVEQFDERRRDFWINTTPRMPRKPTSVMASWGFPSARRVP